MKCNYFFLFVTNLYTLLISNTLRGIDQDASLSINAQSSATDAETKSTEAVIPVTAASQVRNCLF